MILTGGATEIGATGAIGAIPVTVVIPDFGASGTKTGALAFVIASEPCIILLFCICARI